MLTILILSTLFLQVQEPTLKKVAVSDTLSKTLNKEFGEVLETIYPDDVPTISTRALKELKRKNLYLLDTRGKDEYLISHLKHARGVGYLWFDMRSVYDIPKDATVIAYCAVGNRSSRIAEKLIRAGYKNVYILYGGIFEWVNEGNPVYTHNDIQTPQVHGYTHEWSKWLEKGNHVL